MNAKLQSDRSGLSWNLSNAPWDSNPRRVVPKSLSHRTTHSRCSVPKMLNIC